MERTEIPSFEPTFTDQPTYGDLSAPTVAQIKLYRSPEWEGVLSPEIGGTRLMVPRFNIFGIQPVEDYSRVTEREIVEGYRQSGMNLLYESPVWLCAMGKNSIMTLALIDGHHRARYAGKFGIHLIPSIVFTPEEAATLWNRHPKATSQLSVAEYMAMLEEGMGQALKSFDRLCSDSKLPKSIPDVDSIDDLTRRFACF